MGDDGRRGESATIVPTMAKGGRKLRYKDKIFNYISCSKETEI